MADYPSVVVDMQTHLFRYSHAGKVWQLEIVADDEKDARARLARLAFASYLGVRVAKLPHFLIPIAPLATWFRNATVATVRRFEANRHSD